MGAPKSEKYPLTDTVRGLVYEGCLAAAMLLYPELSKWSGMFGSPEGLPLWSLLKNHMNTSRCVGNWFKNSSALCKLWDFSVCTSPEIYTVAISSLWDTLAAHASWVPNHLLGACPNSWHPTKSRGILRARRVSSCFWWFLIFLNVRWCT